MKLIIISGRSGSGKTTCLHVLEDLEYYCVDNIPASLIGDLAKRIGPEKDGVPQSVAVSIDARNLSSDLEQFPDIHHQLIEHTGLDVQIIYLDAEDNTLLKRFSETRRKHPLSNDQISLLEALQQEKALLEPISALSQLSIDTSNLSIHQLRDIVKNRIAEHDGYGTALLFESFGFKNGLPPDADLVFDARCLPNPYWVPELRSLTGLDQAVADYLENQTEVGSMYEDIRRFLERWLPHFQANNRSYITVAIGCTGGQHRSVYLCEKLRKHFSRSIRNTQIRHKEFA